MAKKEKKKAEGAETKKYRISLNPAKRFPLKKRAKRTPTLIRRFVTKNTRIPEENVMISGEVNEAVWKRGISNIPRRLDIEVLLEEGKARVFLKDSKAIASFLQEKKAEKKKKEEKEAEKKKEETKEEKKAVEEKEKIEEQRKEEKKLKEKSSEILEMKRK